MTDAQRIPDYSPIITLLIQYGQTLLTTCPSNEYLVRYTEDPYLLSVAELHTLRKHLSVCLDCVDKIDWLTDG